MFNIRILNINRNLINRLLFGLVISGFGLFLSSLFGGNTYAASFRVEPEIVSTEANQEFTVDIFLDTEGKKTDGADLVLRFNSEKMEALQITPGVVYPDYPITNIEGGKVSVTGIASSTGPFYSGEGLFATVKFKALFGGEETLGVDFVEDSSVESNVALHATGRDILSGVEESVLFIGGQPPSTSPPISLSQASRVLLLVLYVVIIAVIGYLVYRWWSRRLGRGEDVYVPEQVPMDKPPV